MYKFGFSEYMANVVSSIVYLISAVMSPLFGIVVDKTGRNIMWVGIAVFSTIIAHGMLAFTFVNPFVPMVRLGSYQFMLATVILHPFFLILLLFFIFLILLLAISFFFFFFSVVLRYPSNACLFSIASVLLSRL